MPISPDEQAKNCLIKVYVAPVTLKAIDKLAKKDHRKRSSWCNILLENAVAAHQRKVKRKTRARRP